MKEGKSANFFVAFLLSFMMFFSACVSPYSVAIRSGFPVVQKNEAGAVVPVIAAGGYAVAAILALTGVVVSSAVAIQTLNDVPAFDSWANDRVDSGETSFKLSTISGFATDVVASLLGSGAISLYSLSSTVKGGFSAFGTFLNFNQSIAKINNAAALSSGMGFLFIAMDLAGRMYFIKSTDDLWDVYLSGDSLTIYTDGITTTGSSVGIWYSDDLEGFHDAGSSVSVAVTDLVATGYYVTTDVFGASWDDAAAVSFPSSSTFLEGTPEAITSNVLSLDARALADYAASTTVVVDAAAVDTATSYSQVVSSGSVLDWLSDWLWGILNSILDAILSIPGAISSALSSIQAAIASAVQSVVGAVDAVTSVLNKIFDFFYFLIFGSGDISNTFENFYNDLVNLNWGVIWPFCYIYDVQHIYSLISCMQLWDYHIIVDFRDTTGLDGLYFDLDASDWLPAFAPFCSSVILVSFIVGLLFFSIKFFLHISMGDVSRDVKAANKDGN